MTSSVLISDCTRLQIDGHFKSEIILPDTNPFNPVKRLTAACTCGILTDCM